MERCQAPLIMPLSPSSDRTSFASIYLQRVRLIDPDHPDLPMSQGAQWELAALLLEQHGKEGIVAYLGKRYFECHQRRDREEAQRWLVFALKVEALLNLGERAAD